jgi:hypothetical protein
MNSDNMYVYSSRIKIPSGNFLAGFVDRKDHPTTIDGYADIHGIGNYDKSWEICAIDALYPGELAAQPFGDVHNRIIVASHSHFIPMLDSNKSQIGNYKPETVLLFKEGIQKATKKEIRPNKVEVYRGEVKLPVYRRLDFPPSVFNMVLNRYIGLFPNDKYTVDKGIYFFVFYENNIVLFVILYHANHPSSRHNKSVASADYIQVLRDAVADRFGTTHSLFFQGCSGDIRSYIAKKRFSWLPKFYLNQCFSYDLTVIDQKSIDDQYHRAIMDATFLGGFQTSSTNLLLRNKYIGVKGISLVGISILEISKRLSFAFLPFEVSHRYHLELANIPSQIPMRLIVSCSGDVIGYLPHRTQLRFSGYEVDTSRLIFGLKQRISMDGDELWR